MAFVAPVLGFMPKYHNSFIPLLVVPFRQFLFATILPPELKDSRFPGGASSRHGNNANE